MITEGDLKPGAEVEVTINGTLSGAYADSYFTVETDDEYYTFYDNDSGVVKVKVISPPIEQFEVGNVVRHKDSLSIYTILPDDKVYSHMRQQKISFSIRKLTSEQFERLA